MIFQTGIKSGFVLLSVILLSACSSIPVSTMLKFSTFDHEDFAKLQPEEVQALVTVTNNAPLNPDATRLELTLLEPQEQTFLFPVELVTKESIAAQEGWFSTVPEATKYHLQLNEEGINAFKQVQKNGAKRGDKFKMNVFLSFMKLPEDYDDVIMTLALVLDEDEGEVVLFDQATLADAVNAN